MRSSTRFTDAIHTMVLIATNRDNSDADLSSSAFAKSANTNPGFIRQLMRQLRQAGLISSVKGHPMPTLNKEPEEITLAEIYTALNENKTVLRLSTHPSTECGIGINIQYVIQDYYNELHEEIIRNMEKVTLQDIIDRFAAKAGILL